jgi:hypothetical protein
MALRDVNAIKTYSRSRSELLELLDTSLEPMLILPNSSATGEKLPLSQRVEQASTHLGLGATYRTR